MVCQSVSVSFGFNRNFLTNNDDVATDKTRVKMYCYRKPTPRVSQRRRNAEVKSQNVTFAINQILIAGSLETAVSTQRHVPAR